MSVNTDEQPAAGTFDEARALEQLEELHEQILRARAARRRVEAEFDAFVQGFRRERQPHEERVAVAAPEPPAAPASVPDPPVAIASPDSAAAFEREIVAPADSPDAAPDVVPRPLPSGRRGGRAAAAISVGVLAVGAVAFALWGRQSPPASPSTPATAAKPPEPVVTPPPAAAPVVPGVNLELVTHRRVWVRVTIDGKRAFERELAPDQRIPLHGEQAIVIRAGDAGAITVTRDGRDAGALGRDGMIATREFTLGR